MNNVRDYTKGFADYLEKRFSRAHIDLNLGLSSHCMPFISGEGNDTVYGGKYSCGTESRQKSMHFLFCFYYPQTMKDTRVCTQFISEKPLITEFNESGLFRRINLQHTHETSEEAYFLEHQIVRDPQQINSDTLYGEVWSSIFKNFFAQMQSNSK